MAINHINGPREPFGYKLNLATNEKEEIPEQLKALEQAAMYIRSGCSMQSVRDWLVKKTGRSISVPGLLKAIGYQKDTPRS